MFEILCCLILSMALSFGMAVALVEKGREWPIRKYRICIARWLNHHISTKAHRLVNCATCASFWVAIIADLVVGTTRLVYSGGFYFLWPFSGFAAVGITYYLMERLNSISQ